MNFKFKLGFIGFGNMANAILSGLLKKECVNKSEIAFCDLSSEAIEKGVNLGINYIQTATELAESCEYVFFAVKPQVFDSVACEISKKVNEINIISIMAGITIEKMKGYFPNSKIARAMPNTPALVGMGVTGVDSSQYDCVGEAFIVKVFESVGKVIKIKEENINEVIAVSGSGPAYAYQFIKGMYEKALKLGFDEMTAKNLVTSTISGACEMFSSSDISIDKLTSNVCSKGGTTIEAVKVFENEGLVGMIDRAMQACYDRAVELSK